MQEANALYQQAMPTGNVKTQFLQSFLHSVLTSLLRWALAKLNPQARVCISKLSCCVLTQIMHIFSHGQYQWEGRNNPETLWPQQSDFTCLVERIRQRKVPKQLAQSEEILLRRLYSFNKSDNTTADVLEKKLEALMNLQAPARYFLALFFWTCILKFHFH